VRLPQTGVESPSYFFESLGYMVPDRHMDPYFAEFIPLTQHQELKPHVHPGFEFLYVLEGELGLQHGEHQSTLGPGDAVYFDSSTAHSYFCAGPKAASALIVTMHQPLAPSAAPPRHVPGAPMARPLAITTVPSGEKR
jgi:mannose-6-phosphate isomerase-like protein (cupin superfamily)